jgi:hypothetical protein
MDMAIVFATFTMDLWAGFPFVFIEIEGATWILYGSSLSSAICFAYFSTSNWTCWNLYLCCHTLLYFCLFYIQANTSRFSS